MSTNNQLVVIEKNRVYELHEDMCVDNPFYPNKRSLLFKNKDLKIVIIFANNYMKTDVVEYGLRFEIKEQE
jgi:hypothetical protein